MTNRGYTAAAVLLLIVLFFSAATSMKGKSPVLDEVSHHIATGYSFLKTGDFRLNSTSPPLTEEIAALPLLFLNPRLPLDHPSWEGIDRVEFGFQFLYRYNDNADKIVFYSRIPMVLLSVFCGMLVFIFAGELYGKKAGLFALFLYAFSPNILAYSRLVVPDIGMTFFALLALYAFYRFLNKPDMKNVIFTGIALGLAEASKLSALVIIPFFGAFSLYRSIVTRRIEYIAKIVVVFLICALVVFALYFGEVKPFLQNDIDVQEKISYISGFLEKIAPGNQGMKEKVINFAQDTPIPFSTYLMNILGSTNILFVRHTFNPFLLGRYSDTGWWYYYLVVFLLKTPLPALMFLLFAFVLSRRLRTDKVLGESVIVSFMLLFMFVTCFSKLQLSVRYILPVYPLVFIYSSKLVNLKVRKQAVYYGALALLSLWYTAGSISVYPHYISYFNELAGGPDNGWRYLKYGNIDYGQDLPALARYMKDNDIDKVKLNCVTSADIGYYGISYENMQEEEARTPGNEVYAISAVKVDGIEWAKDTQPDAKAGYSIFIYDYRKKGGEGT